MNIHLKFFGITRQITGQSTLEWEIENPLTSSALLAALIKIYPDFKRLNSLLIAINAEYAEEDTLIYPNDEVALIPPVCGG
jgi:molybdopterin converting factor small subunit